MSLSSMELLSAEYQAALARLHRIQDSLPLAGAAGLLVSIGAAAYVLGHRTTLNAGYAWAAPLPFLVAAGVVLVLLAQRASALCRLEELRQQAGSLPPPIPNPYTAFLLRLLAVPIAGGLVLYGLTLFVGWRALHLNSPLSALMFGLTYFVLTAATVLLGWAVQRQARTLAPLTMTQVRQVLLPYPAQWMIGMGLVTGGWMAAWLTAGLNAAQIPLLELLFRRNTIGETGILLSSIASLGLLVFLVFEGLLVPAGLLWRDLRGSRATLGAAPGEINFGYAQVLARLLLALPLAFALGGLPFLILALLIWLQLATEALLTPVSASPASPQRIRAGLLWGALSYSLRFYAGVLVWVGADWTFSVLLLLFCCVGFLALGFRAARQARAARLRSPALLVDPAADPGLAYHLRSSPRWQRAGFLAALIVAIGLVVLQALAENPHFSNELLAAAYGAAGPEGWVVYRQAGLVNSLLLIFDLLVLGLLACAGLVRLFSRSKAGWVLFADRVRLVGLPLFGLGAILLFVAAFPTGIISLAFGGLACFVLAGLLWAEH